MRHPSGPGGDLERRLADEAGARPEDFEKPVARARGARRPLRINLREATLEQEDETTVIARFVLPPGAFATVVLDHLMEG